MANEQIATILRELAFFAELKNENPFKIRALEKSASLLEEQPTEVGDLVATGAIAKIAGVGKGTQEIVREFVAKGQVAEHEALKKEHPGLLDILSLRGLGPKKVKALHEQLGIASLGELEYACQENRLLELKGFGLKTQESILKNIAAWKANRGKAILPMALQQAEQVREELLALPGAQVEALEETGELRRKLPVQSCLEFVWKGPRGPAEASLRMAGFRQEEGSFLRSSPEELPVKIWIAEPGSFGSILLQSTGPSSYVGKENLPSAPTEEEACAAAGITLLPPETRDLGHAPDGLLEESDIRGVFHLHTVWSDGKNTLEEMAAAAVERGLEYLGVSEHSQSAFYANGLDQKRVLEQRKEIDRLQKKYPSLRIFQGIESDILADGSLDYPKDFLAQFDFVIASIHGQMRMPREEMTKRICRALEHPATTWLGHWSGRLLLGRDPFDFDQERVLDAAAKHGKGIELNSNPYRLDLDWTIAPEAAKRGVSIGVFPDAHSVGGLDDLRFGVWMARKAGLTASQVVNTKSGKEMAQWLADRKQT